MPKIITKKTDDELALEAKKIDEMHNFYRLKWKKTKDGVNFEGIVIDKVLFVDLLKSFGFFRYDLGSKQSKFVKISDNKIEDVSEEQIIDFTERYIKKIPEREIIEDDQQIFITTQLLIKKMYDSIDELFKKRLLGRLNPENQIKIMEDEKHCKYVFFRNNYLKISENKVFVGDYSEIKNCIWKDNVLERDYKECDGVTGVFEKFCRRLCGEIFPTEKNYDKFNQKQFDERFLSLKTYIGYLLHSYYKGKLRSICFTDSSEDENQANGRTGKTMLSRSIVKMLQYKLDDKEDKAASVYAEISGKNFDVRDVHRYSKVKLDTKIIHINDLPRFFAIEPLFTDIADGCEAKELYMNKFTVMSKFILSTNHMIKINGESSKDRIRFFEVANHYNSNFSPDMEFGHWFFDDWTNERAIEWHRFDSFMINCIQTYFKHGLIEAVVINLNEKELREFTDKDFYQWMEEKLILRDANGEFIYKTDEDGNLAENPFYTNLPNTLNIERYNKKDVFKHYFEQFKDSMTAKKRAEFNQRKLMSWIRYYIDKKHPELEVVEPKKSSGGNYWIYFNYREDLKK